MTRGHRLNEWLVRTAYPRLLVALAVSAAVCIEDEIGRRVAVFVATLALLKCAGRDARRLR